MLSWKMAQVLSSVSVVSRAGFHRDGRTLRALQTRGLITKVEWKQELDTHTFKLTKSGLAMSRNLRFNHDAQLKEMLL